MLFIISSCFNWLYSTISFKHNRRKCRPNLKLWRARCRRKSKMRRKCSRQSLLWVTKPGALYAFLRNIYGSFLMKLSVWYVMFYASRYLYDICLLGVMLCSSLGCAAYSPGRRPSGEPFLVERASRRGDGRLRTLRKAWTASSRHRLLRRLRILVFLRCLRINHGGGTARRGGAISQLSM